MDFEVGDSVISDGRIYTRVEGVGLAHQVFVLDRDTGVVYEIDTRVAPPQSPEMRELMRRIGLAGIVLSATGTPNPAVLAARTTPAVAATSVARTATAAEKAVRNLTVADVGGTGLAQFNATMAVRGEVATVHVSAMTASAQASGANLFAVVNRLIAAAKAEGATTLRINADIANPGLRELISVASKRYDVITGTQGSVGILVPIK